MAHHTQINRAVARRAFRLVACASLLASFSRGAAAQAAAEVKHAIASNVSAPLEIHVSPSRAQSSAGSGMGIIVTLMNVGGDTLYLTEQGVMVTLPPELLIDGAANPAYFGWFTTEPHPPGGSQDLIMIALAPGASYPVPYNFAFSRNQMRLGPTDDTRSSGWFSSDAIVQLRRYIGFSPGDYQLSIVAKYWKDPRKPPMGYTTQAQMAMIHVAAPQSVILLGAIIGGLLAYLLIPPRRRQASGRGYEAGERGGLVYTWRVTRPYRRRVWGAVAAMLWSAMVTILLARLSETQFVVRVSVNDFWGAITIGFIAQMAGSKWLERLLPGTADESAAIEPTATARSQIGDAAGVVVPVSPLVE